MIGAPTTTADLFTQMAQAHFQKTASLVVQASDAYLMGKVAAHSPNLQLEMLRKQASAYEPQMSKVASGYVRFLEKLSYTDPERAAYLAKQAGIGSFIGRLAGGAARGGQAMGRGAMAAGRGVSRGIGAAGGAVGRGGAAAGRAVGRSFGAAGRGVGRATGWAKQTAGRAGSWARSAPGQARSGMARQWSGFKSELGSGYRKAMGGTGYAGPQRAPGAYASPASRVSGTAQLAPPTGTATQYTGAIGPMPAKPTAVRARRGMRGAAPEPTLQARPAVTPRPAAQGGPAAKARRGLRGAAPEPTLRQPAATPSTRGFQGPQRPTGPGATPSTPGFQGPQRPTGPAASPSTPGFQGPQRPTAAAATPSTPGFQGPAPQGTPPTSAKGPYRTPDVREVREVASQAADVLPSGGQQQGGDQGQGFKFPWLKAGLMAGAVGVPMVAMKGMETAQNVLGSNVQAPYRAGMGAPQTWNRSYQF